MKGDQEAPLLATNSDDGTQNQSTSNVKQRLTLRALGAFALCILFTSFAFVSETYQTRAKQQAHKLISLALPTAWYKHHNSSLNVSTSTLGSTVKTSKQIVSSQKPKSKQNLTLCPLIPPGLGTRISLNLEPISDDDLAALLKPLGIQSGGMWRPDTCISRHRVAIIVPYRDRAEHLSLFLRHMHPFLSKQQIDYGIFVVEPLAHLTFNRGLLMNIGFLRALNITQSKWQCFMFHDVDL